MKVAEEIKRRILEGIYAPNAYLPSERKLAEEQGFSRPTISAAIDLLLAEGIVSAAPGRGARVLPLRDRLTHPEIGVFYNLGGRTEPSREGQPILEGIHDVLTRDAYRFPEIPVIPAGDPAPSRIERAMPQAKLLSQTKRFGAFIFVECADMGAEVTAIEEQKIPIVVANLEDQHVEVSATIVNHRKVTADAVAALAGMGHRRIAFLGTLPSMAFYGESLEGFKAGMREAGLPIEEAFIRLCEDSYSIKAYLSTRELLDDREPPTGIVCARDDHAVGAAHAIAEKGLTVGRDVSLVGFGNLGIFKEEAWLTTFREPVYEMGSVAAEMLVERIAGGWRPPEKRELEARLVLRRSAGPLWEPPARLHPI